MQKVAALIIDIKGSKKYQPERRKTLQKYILVVIKELNHIFESSIEKKVEFSAGDEIQGLFSSVDAAYLYYRFFCMILSPIEFHIGIGVGEWTIKIENAGTTVQDGIAYHNARKAIDFAKTKDEYQAIFYSGNSIDVTVNALLGSFALIVKRQSKYQNDIMLLTELLYPITINNIINCYDIQKVIDIIQEKEQFLIEEQKKQNIGHGYKCMKNSVPVFYRIKNRYTLKTCPIDVYTKKVDFCILDGQIKGLPQEIAEITGVTRQNIDMSIKAGYIYEARNITIATLHLLEDVK